MFLFPLLLVYSPYVETSPRVESTAGSFVGQTHNVTLSYYARESRSTYTVDSFLGIPFAQAPVGNLRFKPPQTSSQIERDFKANTAAPACQQDSDGAEHMSEDCLYLNLWRPTGTMPGHKLNVLVWIFGGAFISGSPSHDSYRGDVLAAYGRAIVVNLNYRLGVFGFLYLGNSEAPGNVGLLDQQLALEWINQNIAAFGGDPNSVTIFGESAGAASVSAHIFAEKSQTLFRRAFILSGSMSNTWATQPRAINYSTLLADELGCRSGDIAACLRDIPAKELTKAATELKSLAWGLGPDFMEIPWAPIACDRNFFKTDFRKIMSSGQFLSKDILIGFMKDESSLFTTELLPSYFNSIESFLSLDDFDAVINASFGEHSVIDRKAIAYQYTRYSAMDCDAGFYRDAFNAAVSDLHFVCDIVGFGKRMQQHGANVYLFRFDQRISTSSWPPYAGVTHGSANEFVFGLPLLFPEKHTEADLQFTKRIVDIWLNFSKTGAPEDNWPRLSGKSTVTVLLKHVRQFPKVENLNSNMCDFWREMQRLRKEMCIDQTR